MKKMLNWLKAKLKRIFLQRDPARDTGEPLVKQHTSTIKNTARSAVEIAAAAKISEEIYKHTQLGQNAQNTQDAQNTQLGGIHTEDKK